MIGVYKNDKSDKIFRAEQSRAEQSNVNILKGIAIILVVIGHCIQFGISEEYTANQLFFDNTLFKIIYSFHMPLFALISGYLFVYTIKKRNLAAFIKNRFLTLVVPLMFWALVDFTIYLFAIQDCNLGYLALVKEYVKILLTTLWFLWAILFSSIIVGFFYYFNIDRWYFLVAMIGFFFISPDSFMFDKVKYLYPYFVLGYILNNTYGVLIKKELSSKIYLPILSVLFILLIVCFYDRNSYIYTSGITLIESQNAIAQLLTDVFRWGVGIVGCLVAVLIVERVEQYSIINQILSKLGKESLGIYIVNVYYVKYMLPNLMTMQPIGAVGFAIEIVGSILICYVGALILKKIPFLNSFMLGFRV